MLDETYLLAGPVVLLNLKAVVVVVWRYAALSVEHWASIFINCRCQIFFASQVPRPGPGAMQVPGA